jgi:hypothetical protein
MKIKLIGLYQLITGIFGFILIASNITKVFKSIDVFFTFLIGLLLFAGVAYAGYALLNARKNALKYSIWAQALQIISFTAHGVQYLFTGSAFLFLQYSNGISIKWQIEPIAYNISGVSDLLPIEFRIYIVPIVLVLLLCVNKK